MFVCRYIRSSLLPFHLVLSRSIHLAPFFVQTLAAFYFSFIFIVGKSIAIQTVSLRAQRTHVESLSFHMQRRNNNRRRRYVRSLAGSVCIACVNVVSRRSAEGIVCNAIERLLSYRKLSYYLFHFNINGE